MSGFTAINSSTPAPQTHLSDSADADPRRAAADTHITVASAYLGRGEAEENATNGKSVPKKATSKGKKRATTAPNQQDSKRRKTSNASDGMPAIKPRAPSKKQAVTAKSSANNAKTTKKDALQHEQSLKSVKKTSQPSKQQQTSEEADSTSASSVSVIAPSTSMGALHAASQQTSFDAVKSSSGHGTVLYNSSSSPTKQQEGDVQLSRPMLSQRQSPTKSSNSRVSKPNSTESTEMRERNYDLDFNDDDDFGALFDELSQHIEGSSTQNKAADPAGNKRITRSSAKTVHQRSTPGASKLLADEDFLGDDDDDFEAVPVAHSAEMTPKASKKKKKANASKRSTQLPTPAASDRVEDDTAHANETSSNMQDLGDDTIMLNSDGEDEEMIELDKALKEAEKMGLKPRLRRQNTRHVDEHEDYGGALLDDAEKQLLNELKCTAKNGESKPIVRSGFPQPVLDRSPVFGATNTTILRTCFRLGEALNVGSHAVRTKKNMILEIYARVMSSSRSGRKQHFSFRDLYHDKPPHLEGDFELWSQSRLWDLDGKAFVKAEERAEGVMCRAVARMKRDGMKWRLEVLSIWEAGWEDVEAVAGIHGKDAESMIAGEE